MRITLFNTGLSPKYKTQRTKQSSKLSFGTTEHIKDYINNYEKIDKNVHRGSAPMHRKAFAALKEASIKTIIDLREPEWEVESSYIDLVSEFGFEYVNVDLRNGFGGQKYKGIKTLIECVKQNKPVFIHCTAGQDRTGGFVALYEHKALGKEPKEIIENSIKKHGGNAQKIKQYFEELNSMFERTRSSFD